MEIACAEHFRNSDQDWRRAWDTTHSEAGFWGDCGANVSVEIEPGNVPDVTGGLSLLEPCTYELTCQHIVLMYEILII